MELFECIRKAHFLENKSIRSLAKQHRIHRRIVRQALASAKPPERKKGLRTGEALTEPVRQAIDAWLTGDQTAPKKQRHTSRRIFCRLIQEYDYQGAESTLRKYLGKRKRFLGLSHEVFIPQVHQPGEEAEVDWYEAEICFPWGNEKAQIFLMRACCSGREFHRAFKRQTQQAFLEGHMEAFAHFGGVFKKIRYDNLSSAVKKVMQGRNRIETERFAMLRSHYLFESVFCMPGLRGAHEKGGVEGAVGRFRRAHLVPVPKFKSYAELNEFLMRSCLKDDSRTRVGHANRIEEDWERELASLQQLPKEKLEVHTLKMPVVSQKSLVTVESNQYSVPTRLVSCRVEARLFADKIELWQGGKCVANHERSYGRYHVKAELDHYVEIFQRKPGAFPGALPLSQARANGQWSALYESLWRALNARLGESEGTQAMITLLLLHRSYSREEIHVAMEWALERGGVTVEAIELFIRHKRGEKVLLDPLSENEFLKRYDRPVGDVTCYDQLLKQARAAV